MIVTVSGRSGLRNAYVSVLSAEGSSEINGASRCLNARAAAGLPPRDASAVNNAPKAAAARTRTASFRIVLCAPFGRPVGSAVAVVSALIRCTPQTGSTRTETPYDANERDERDSSADVAHVRAPLRRGGGRHAGALRRVGIGRALRPLRSRRIRSRAKDPSRREARRGRSAGRVSRRLAQRRPVHPGTR